jgi:hypothetical protein
MADGAARPPPADTAGGAVPRGRPARISAGAGLLDDPAGHPADRDRCAVRAPLGHPRLAPHPGGVAAPAVMVAERLRILSAPLLLISAGRAAYAISITLQRRT